MIGFYVFGRVALFFTVLLCFVIFPQHGASGYNPQRTNLKRNKESDYSKKKSKYAPKAFDRS